MLNSYISDPLTTGDGRPGVLFIDFFRTVTGPEKGEVLHLEQLEIMPAQMGCGAPIHSAAIPQLVRGSYHYVGVNLTYLLDRVGPLPADYDVVIEASDGYTLELSESQVQRNVTVWSGRSSCP